MPPGQELKDTDLLQLPVVRVSGVISLRNFQSLAPVSAHVRGDLFLILDEKWQGRTTEELASRLIESLNWLFVRKTLYPESRAILRFRNQQYEFGWFPKTRRLTLYFPSGFTDYDDNQARFETEAVLPLNKILNPLLIRLTPSVQSHEFIPFSIPNEGEISINLIGASYFPFLRAVNAERREPWVPSRGPRDFISRNLQGFPIDE